MIQHLLKLLCTVLALLHKNRLKNQSYNLTVYIKNLENNGDELQEEEKVTKVQGKSV